MEQFFIVYPAQKFSMPLHASKPRSCNEFRGAQYSIGILKKGKDAMKV